MKKTVYKFAHLADLHLGARPKGIRQRKLDVFNAFSWAVDEIRRRKDINGVLLCGDTFHTKVVDWETIFRFSQEYDLLKSDGVDIYQNPGNHDFVPEFLWTDMYPGIIVPGFGYMKNSYVNLYSVDWDTIPNTTKVLDRLKRKIDKGCFNVLMMHQAVEGHIFYDDQKSFISLKYLKTLKPYFNYIALGHIHHSYIIDDLAFNPGSPEYLNVNDWGAVTGMFIVTIYNDKTFNYEFVEIPKRNYYKIKVDIDQMDKLDKKEILCYINETNIKPKSMLYIEFVGDKELTPKVIKEVEVDLGLQYQPILLKTRNFTRREKVDISKPKSDPFATVFGPDAELAKHIAQEQSINLDEL